MAWSIHWIATVLVSGFFAITGIYELTMWRKYVDLFTYWGYPKWFPVFAYSLKIIAGILVLIPQVELMGLILCSLFCVAAVATLAMNRDQLLSKALPVNAGLIALSVTSYFTS